MRVYVSETSTNLEDMNRDFSPLKDDSNSLFVKSGELQEGDFFLLCDTQGSERKKVLNLTRGCIGYPQRSFEELCIIRSEEVEQS